MACETVFTEHGALRLEVSGLQFVDPTGISLLRDLAQRGAGLGGCSGFLTELLRERDERPTAPEPLPTPRSDGDGALVNRLRRGEPEAFESLVRQYGGRMLATARRLVGTEDEARDVVQEAFLAAFRAIDSFAGAARLSTWLHRIVVNGALMKLRSRRRRREESIEGLLPRFDDDGHWAEPAPQWDNASDTLCERQETREMVRNAIDRLPASYRSVLILRDIEELDTDETASLLGITPNAVKTRLHRARQALRTLLEREFLGQADRSSGHSRSNGPAAQSA